MNLYIKPRDDQGYLEYCQKDDIDAVPIVIPDHIEGTNPYLELFQNNDLEETKTFQPERVLKVAQLRRIYRRRFAWAVPNQEAIDAIKKFLPQGIYEIGAGSGYWARMVTQQFNHNLYYAQDNFSSHAFEYRWYNVQIEPLTSNVPPTLMFCWPSYDDPFATNALKEHNPTNVIYIGEWGGCTADDEFHDILNNDYQDLEIVNIPQYWGLHDRLYILKRK